MKLRLRELREKRGLSLEAVADAVGMSPGYLSRLERSRRPIDSELLEAFAEFYGTRPKDLIADESEIAVVGRVGAGAVLYPVDDYPLGEGLYKVPCPERLNPKTTIAVEVEGDSMLPIGEGWLLFYGRDYEGVPVESLGHLCVAKMADDGPIYVKRLRPGYKPGRFNLISSSGAVLEDAELEWAAPIVLALPPEDKAKP
jgi:transcriptional regulator with XRE-family HTH domain